MLHRLKYTLKKSMKSFFTRLFSDNNNINEKSIIGFSSFVVMVIIAIINTYTAYKNIDFQIHEYVYESFLIMALGSLGIGSVDKYITRKTTSKENNIDNNTEELG
jgi:hypothetical protein